MPLGSSIRWTPRAGVGQREPPFSVFITQPAFVAVHGHLSAPDGAGGCGFLAGSLLHCPETGQPYVLVDSTIRLPWPSVSHDAKHLIAQGWAQADEELRATRRHLVGWYHGHPPTDTTLSRAEADAHLTFFDRPWHVALVVAPGDEPGGGFFCHTASPEWQKEHLPFYEVLGGDPRSADARQATAVPWVNYCRAEDIVAAGDVAVAAGAGTQTRILFPEEFAGEEIPVPSAEPRTLRRAARYGMYGLAGLLPAAGLVGLYLARGAAWPVGRSAGGNPTPAVAAERIDRLADSVAAATAAFDVRARLFESHRMTCFDLGRGMTDVEVRWMAYNVAGGGAPVTRDSARSARDQALYGAVDAVERQFEGSACPRP